MADSLTLPGPRVPLVDAKGLASLAWFQFFRGLSVAPDATPAADVSGFLPTTTTITGINGIRVIGTLASGLVQIQLASVGSLIQGNGIALTGNLTDRLVGTGDVTIAVAPTPLLPADEWSQHSFQQTNAVQGPWLGAAISSGTMNTAIPAASLDGLFTGGNFIRSSTTANGGYRYKGSSEVAIYFGSNTHKFECTFKWLTSFTGRTVRMGLHDSTTVADAVDGAYFEVVADTVSAKTANNSARTTNATTYTLALNTAYTFDIEVAASGAEARFRIYAGNSGTPVYDETNTTNIPTTTARSFGVGIVATESSTTASDIGILYRMGYGNVAGYNRARG